MRPIAAIPAIAVLVVCLVGAVSGSALDGYGIVDIDISGNDAIPSAVLSDQMALHGTGRIKRFFGKDLVRFSEEMMIEDLRRIIRYYQRQGFLDAHAYVSDTVINSEKRRLEYTITIEEGSPILVDTIVFALDSTVSADTAGIRTIVDNFRPHMELRSGRRFRDAHVQFDQDSLVMCFRNNGYPYAAVAAEIDVDEEEFTTDITYRIKPGVYCTFGDVTVNGIERTSQDLILNLLDFKPGQTYSKKRIDRTRQRIHGLGRYRVATVKAQLSDSTASTVPVNIHVSEAPRYDVRFGVGYGREDRFRAFVQGQRRGFLGGARRLELLLKTSHLEPYNIDLVFVEPYFFHHRLALHLNPFFREENEPGYNVRRLGLHTSFMYRVTYDLALGTGYILEKVNSGDGGDLPAELSDSLYNKAGPWVSASYNNSKPVFSPRRGYWLSVVHYVNGAFQDLPDFRFSKTLLDIRNYRAIGDPVLAFRFKFGRIVSHGDNPLVPVEERFYSGGASSVRGWRRQQLGPKNDQGEPIGGKSLVEGSAEIRFDLWSGAPKLGKLIGTTFLDFGNVWLQENHWPLNELRYSAGVGIGILTPIGPVHVDLARPIFDEETKWQWHFNIGYAF
jgi:outer membrane protein insertion porin family